jgi:hypothetical protein
LVGNVVAMVVLVAGPTVDVDVDVDVERVVEVDVAWVVLTALWQPAATRSSRAQSRKRR